MEAKGAKGAVESPTSIDMRAVIVEAITVLLPKSHLGISAAPGRCGDGSEKGDLRSHSGMPAIRIPVTSRL